MTIIYITILALQTEEVSSNCLSNKWKLYIHFKEKKKNKFDYIQFFSLCKLVRKFN